MQCEFILAYILSFLFVVFLFLSGLVVRPHPGRAGGVSHEAYKCRVVKGTA